MVGRFDLMKRAGGYEGGEGRMREIIIEFMFLSDLELIDF